MYTAETGEKIVSPQQTPVITDWLLSKVDSAIKDADNVIISRVALDKIDINLFKDIADKNDAEFIVYRLDTHWEDKIPEGVLKQMQSEIIPWSNEIVIS
jgi:hypothetical protein